MFNKRRINGHQMVGNFDERSLNNYFPLEFFQIHQFPPPRAQTARVGIMPNTRSDIEEPVSSVTTGGSGVRAARTTRHSKRHCGAGVTAHPSGIRAAPTTRHSKRHCGAGVTTHPSGTTAIKHDNKQANDQSVSTEQPESDATKEHFVSEDHKFDFWLSSQAIGEEGHSLLEHTPTKEDLQKQKIERL